MEQVDLQHNGDAGEVALAGGGAVNGQVKATYIGGARKYLKPLN